MDERSTELWLYDLVQELRFCLNLAEGWMHQLQHHGLPMDCVRNNVIRAIEPAKETRHKMTDNS